MALRFFPAVVPGVSPSLGLRGRLSPSYRARMGRRSEGWAGGYVRRDTRGVPHYWIRRRVGQTRYEVATRTTTLRAAMKELERFETDPAGYEATGEVHDALRLTPALTDEFLAASKARGVSREWRKRQALLLLRWAKALGRSDLRRVQLQTIIDSLPKTGRKDAIATIKRLYSWLREQGRIEASEDPTLARLRVPQSTPEQHTRPKAVSRADYEKVRAKLSGVYRDALDVLAATGWHVSELHRFAQGGTFEEYRGKQEGVVGVIVTPLHKSGGTHRTAVGAEALGAARRLRENGGLAVSRFHSALLRACDAAGVPRFGPGQLRHSVATWAVESGADPAAVAAFLGHRSATTTKRFYATLAVPPKVPTLR